MAVALLAWSNELEELDNASKAGGIIHVVVVIRVCKTIEQRPNLPTGTAVSADHCAKVVWLSHMTWPSGPGACACARTREIDELAYDSVGDKDLRRQENPTHGNVLTAHTL